MSLYRIRRSLRAKLVQQFLRLMQTEEVRHHLNQSVPEYGSIRNRIGYVPNPYDSSEVTRSERSKSAIFISGRFRSGSTLLWNIFRSLEGYTAYYEPFNERRWFDQGLRGGHTDESHRGVSEYWSEYSGLKGLSGHYREDWIRHHLFMDENSFDFSMKEYIDSLISGAAGRAVLQFNRVDFRLGWLRANYPDARIVHIYRNPRDQWCSVLRDAEHYPYDSTSVASFKDRFYLKMWSRDLCRHFPFLTEYETHHQYYLFYLIWKLSYCFGTHYSDISISMERLTEEPEQSIRSVLSVINEEPCDIPESADLSFVKPSQSRWIDYAPANWFRDIEQECDSVVNEFLRGLPKS